MSVGLSNAMWAGSIMGGELMDILNGPDVHQSNVCDEPFLANFWLVFDESDIICNVIRMYNIVGMNRAE